MREGGLLYYYKTQLNYVNDASLPSHFTVASQWYASSMS